MHQLALMDSVIEMVLGPIDARVALVRLENGALAGVDLDEPRALVVIATRARYRSCGREEPMRSLAAECSCGSFDRALVAGHEIRVKEVEVY